MPCSREDAKSWSIQLELVKKGQTVQQHSVHIKKHQVLVTGSDNNDQLPGRNGIELLFVRKYLNAACR